MSTIQANGCNFYYELEGQPAVLAGMKNFREAPAIAGAGRFVHWERPDEFNAVVRAFLRQLT